MRNIVVVGRTGAFPGASPSPTQAHQPTDCLILAKGEKDASEEGYMQRSVAEIAAQNEVCLGLAATARQAADRRLVPADLQDRSHATPRTSPGEEEEKEGPAFSKNPFLLADKRGLASSVSATSASTTRNSRVG